MSEGSTPYSETPKSTPCPARRAAVTARRARRVVHAQQQILRFLRAEGGWVDAGGGRRAPRAPSPTPRRIANLRRRADRPTGPARDSVMRQTRLHNLSASVMEHGAP